MKRSKFSEEQVVRILQKVESGKAVREVCRAHGVSEGTFYVWKRKYAGMETQDVKRLRELEAENSAGCPGLTRRADREKPRKFPLAHPGERGPGGEGSFPGAPV